MLQALSSPINTILQGKLDSLDRLLFSPKLSRMCKLDDNIHMHITLLYLYVCIKARRNACQNDLTFLVFFYVL